jgi:hypothetical protein
MPDPQPSDFDSPAESEARVLAAKREAVCRVLASPEWSILVEYLQARFRDRLARVLSATSPDELDEARADMRAILALGLEFGSTDLRIEGNLASLRSMIDEGRRSIAAQIGLSQENQ